MSLPFVVLQKNSTLGTGVKDGSKQLHCWLISNFLKYPLVKLNVTFIAVLHLYHYFIVSPLYHHLWKHSWIQAFGLAVSVQALLLPPWQAVESQADSWSWRQTNTYLLQNNSFAASSGLIQCKPNNSPTGKTFSPTSWWQSYLQNQDAPSIANCVLKSSYMFS